MNISVEMSFNALKVRFGDVTHLRIDATKLTGHQSWREGYGNHKFVIEYTTTGGQIVCEYDTEDKWLAILKGLDAALDQPNKPTLSASSARVEVLEAALRSAQEQFAEICRGTDMRAGNGDGWSFGIANKAHEAIRAALSKPSTEGKGIQSTMEKTND